MSDDAQPDRKSPVEQAFEVFVYAPLGLMLEARNLLPQLIERGRQQMTMAKMVGQFAVQKGQTDANRAIGRANEQANTMLTGLGLVNPPAPARPANPEPSVAAPVRAAPEAPTPLAMDTGDLALSGYDSLAASHVIPRLPGLSNDELEAVRAYEAAHRRRKTILNRIAQLQSA